MIRLIEGFVLALVLWLGPGGRAETLPCPSSPDFAIEAEGAAVDDLRALPPAAIRAACIARDAGLDLHNLTLIVHSGGDCAVFDAVHYRLCVPAETRLHGDSATILVHDMGGIGRDGAALVHEMIHVHRMNEDAATMSAELVVEEGVVIELTRSLMDRYARTRFIVEGGSPR